MKKGNVCTAAAILAALFLTAGCSMELMFENEQALLEAIGKGSYVSLSYEGNNACHGSVPVPSAAYRVNEEVTVLDNTGDFYKTGFSFSGWNTKHDGSGYSLQPGDTFIMASESVVLYAMWDYLIGSIGPAGGTVFYDKGAYSDGWRYLEAAPYDWNTVQKDRPKDWSPYTGHPNNGTAIGQGAENTAALLRFYYPDTLFAAYEAAAYDGGGYTDWFLPSKDELHELWKLRIVLGGFEAEWYWSSSLTDDGAWAQNFIDGIIAGDANQDAFHEDSSRRVRPVRSF